MTDRVLVTGGAGMIGSNLVRRLLRDGLDVEVADNLWRGRLEYLEDEDGNSLVDLESSFHQVDLAVPGVLDGIISKFDVVYHLADIVAGINYVFDNQGSLFRQNLLINSNVVESVRRAEDPPGAYVYVGTACSFPAHLQSGPDADPLREEDQYPAAPESAYGWSKLMGEYEALLMEKETGIPVSVLSLHNVYGAPCVFDASTGQVIPSLIRKAVNYPEEAFEVWGSGAQGRAFVHVDDVVEALVAAKTLGLGQGVIQIGPSVCTTIAEIARTVVKLSGQDIDIFFDTSKPEGDRGRRADYSKARRVLDWEPRVSLEEGLRALYDWISSQSGAGEG
jgi:GDP-D-mannose 3',5'-epimerase